MLITFTGTQSGMTNWQKEQLFIRLKDLECTELIHGDCIGADKEANEISLKVGIRIFTIHPSLYDHKRAYCFNPEKRSMHLKSDYHSIPIASANTLMIVNVKWMEPKKPLERNHDMVDKAGLIIACPKEYKMEIRSGTWATVRYAWKNKKDIIIIPPVERPEEESLRESESI